MNHSPRPPMGLLHFTDQADGLKFAVDCRAIKIFQQGQTSTVINYWDGSWDHAKESFDELTSRYERIIRGKPSVEIEGDRSGE